MDLDSQIHTVAEQLRAVQTALDKFKEKQRKKESIDEAAIEFVEKADLVIQRAEKGEIQLTEDQKRRIRNNLVKISAALTKNRVS